MKTPHSLAAAAALLLTGSAHAAYTAYIYESSGNVLASGSGSLNLAGTVGAGVGATVALMAPTFGLLHTGVAGSADRYANIVGPVAFGPGALVPASSSSGDLVGIRGVVGEFFVPTGYVSGAPLSSSAVWNATTIAALGLTPGSYVWTWAGDTFTVNVGAPPPGPASIPTLSGAALGALALLLGLLARASKRFRRR
jgi:hypothetical protein|nr:hypothetical protein [uncultured Acidovorax sp.]